MAFALWIVSSIVRSPEIMFGRVGWAFLRDSRLILLGLAVGREIEDLTEWAARPTLLFEQNLHALASNTSRSPERHAA